MAHRTPKINDTVKFTDQQQAILNDAVEQLMEAGGLTALTQAHFNEAMKIVAQRRPARGTEAPFDTGRRKSQSAALDTATCTVGAVAPAVCFSTTREKGRLRPRGRLFKTVLCSFFDEMRKFNQFLVKPAAVLNGRKKPVHG